MGLTVVIACEILAQKPDRAWILLSSWLRLQSLLWRCAILGLLRLDWFTKFILKLIIEQMKSKSNKNLKNLP